MLPLMSTAPPPEVRIGPRRAFLIPIVLAGLSMLGPFSIDTPFPAFAALQDQFAVGAQVTQQLVSAYLLAFAAMSAFHGPLSDAIGRRPVMLGGLAMYALASVAAALAPTIGLLLVCRVVQGLAAGGGVIVGRTIIRDLYSGERAQKLMSRVMMIFGLAPAVAPIIGGWLLRFGGWRGIFWFLTGFAVLMAAAVVTVLPETHPTDRRTPLSVRGLLGGLVQVARSPRFHRVSWAGSFTFGGYFLYIGAAAIIVVDLLGRGPSDFWMLFLPLISGIVTGSWVSGRLAGRMGGRRVITIGFAVAVPAAVANVVLAAIPTTATLPYAVIGPAVVGFGVAMGYPSLQLAVLDLFPRNRGAAVSMTTFLTLVLNALGAGVLAPLVTRSLLILAVTALGYMLIGAAFWGWHLRVDRGDARRPRMSPPT